MIGRQGLWTVLGGWLKVTDNSPTTKRPNQQEKKAAIAKNALACFGGKDKDEGRLNLEELRRFFL